VGASKWWLANKEGYYEVQKIRVACILVSPYRLILIPHIHC
jgi:hypothetical protein